MMSHDLLIRVEIVRYEFSFAYTGFYFVQKILSPRLARLCLRLELNNIFILE